MIELSIRGLAKDHGSTRTLHPLDLDVERAEFVTVLGPSGCGKSTLLRLLMGIMSPSAGTIHLGGERIDTLPPERRDISMVFQTYALFPHMSVRENLAFGLRMKKVPKAERAARIDHAVSICNLGPYVGRMPRELSGGQQQRVALARAIVMRPRLLLFDEPLSNLDAKLRDSLRADLVALHRESGATSLYVTHDQSEAMAMSDRIVVMNGGRIVETGTPAALYRTPQTRFTATFLGQTNLFEGETVDGHLRLPWGASVPADRQLPPGRATISARPETLDLAPDPQGEGVVSAVSFLGSGTLYTVVAGPTSVAVLRPGGEALIETGTRVALRFLSAPHALKETVETAPVEAGRLAA